MRLFSRLIAVLALLFILGFFAFVAQLPRADQFDLPAARAKTGNMGASDIGIVALTGGGGTRIEKAIGLYREGVAARVLISGTHPSVRKVDLAGDDGLALFDCCVDLGTKAQTTIGNATETRDWTRRHGYRVVYLVTSDYHLPRATLELKSVAPDLEIIGVPVASQALSTKGWYTSPRALRRLGGEYGKYLVSTFRSFLS